MPPSWCARSLNPPATRRVELSPGFEGKRGRLMVDLYSQDNTFVNLVDLGGKLLAPDGTTGDLTFSQVAPGRYRSNFDASVTGLYYLSLYQFGKSKANVPIAPVS